MWERGPVLLLSFQPWAGSELQTRDLPYTAVTFPAVRLVRNYATYVTETHEHGHLAQRVECASSQSWVQHGNRYSTKPCCTLIALLLAFIDFLRTIINSLLRLFCCRVIIWQRTVEDRKMPFCIIHLHFGIYHRFFGSFRGPDARLCSVYCRRGRCHLRFLTRNWHRRFSWTISVGNFRCR